MMLARAGSRTGYSVREQQQKPNSFQIVEGSCFYC